MLTHHEVTMPFTEFLRHIAAGSKAHPQLRNTIRAMCPHKWTILCDISNERRVELACQDCGARKTVLQSERKP